MPVWPLQADCRKFYGAPGANQTTIEPPFAMYYDGDSDGVLEPGERIKKFTINRKCADSALRVLQKVAVLYPTVKERATLGIDNFSGCFNNRAMRGGTSPSMHAYACAIDFDQGRNQLKWRKEGNKGADGKVRNIPRLSLPDAMPFWQAWEAEGWISLGRTCNYDWMHVQAARL